MGYNTLNKNTTGRRNVAVGSGSLHNNSTGESNVAIGYNPLNGNTTGNDNFAIGNYVLFANTTGSKNIAMGYLAMRWNTLGGNNIAIGESSLSDNESGGYNIAVGANALTNIKPTVVTNMYNVAVGDNTGHGIVTGTNNTILGSRVTGLSAGLSNNIILADGEGNQRIRVIDNGNVGIGQESPTEKLEVGTIKATDINFTGLPVFADEAAATAGGLSSGDLYRTSTGEIRIKL